MAILFEDNFDIVTEAFDDDTGSKKLHLRGVFMEAEKENQNGRTYKYDDIKKATDFINERANTGRHILGELDHRDSMEVQLQNVSHKIIDIEMKGNQAVGDAIILETPNGKIAESLIHSGVNVGVSSRGGGKVNGQGKVENFHFVTVDMVANPSCQSAVPESIWESLEMYKRGMEVKDLSEAVLHDPVAQKYFEKEIKKFIQETFQKNKK